MTTGTREGAALATAVGLGFAFDFGLRLALGSSLDVGYVGVCAGFTLAAALVVFGLDRTPSRGLVLPLWSGLQGFALGPDPVSGGAAGIALALATWALLVRSRPPRATPATVGSAIGFSTAVAFLFWPYAGALGLQFPSPAWLLACQVVLFASGLALVRLHLALEPRWPWLPGVPRVVVTCLVLVIALAAYAFQQTRPSIEKVRAAPAREGPGGPIILLLVLDTVRADHLSIYGHDRPTTPQLAQLLQRYPDARLYPWAFSPASWTVPSHASLVTGTLPSVHGAHSGQAENLLYSAVSTSRMYAEQTLGEVLAAAGFHSGAVLANKFVTRIEGMSRGFDVFVHPRAMRPMVLLGEQLREAFAPGWYAGSLKPYPSAAQINKNVVRFLSQCGGAPCFVLANYMEAHSPYLAPAPFAGIFAGDRPLRGLPDASLLDPPALVALKRDRYDEAILALDDALGRLFRRLDEMQLLDRSWIIVTSDHGEAFGEHGSTSHGTSLYNEQVRIPLLVKPPLGEPLPEIADPVGLLDVAATVAGIAGRTGFGEGQDLRLPPRTPRSVIIEFRGQLRRELARYGRSSREPSQAIVRGRFKLIANQHLGNELYDLQRDPSEQSDLAALDRQEVGVLLGSLRRFQVPSTPAGGPARGRGVAPDREALRQLGYVE